MSLLVFGHKNPDTDSICSAISYAYLKNELSQKQEEGATRRDVEHTRELLSSLVREIDKCIADLKE